MRRDPEVSGEVQTSSEARPRQPDALDVEPLCTQRRQIDRQRGGGALVAVVIDAKLPGAGLQIEADFELDGFVDVEGQVVEHVEMKLIAGHALLAGNFGHGRPPGHTA